MQYFSRQGFSSLVSMRYSPVFVILDKNGNFTTHFPAQISLSTQAAFGIRLTGMLAQMVNSRKQSRFKAKSLTFAYKLLFP